VIWVQSGICVASVGDLCDDAGISCMIGSLCMILDDMNIFGIAL
jgi:hypothetical protein